MFFKNSLKFNFVRTYFKLSYDKSFIMIEKINDVNKTNLIETEKLKFPKIWLRDNCQCDQCFHKSSNSRKINWEHFNIKDIKVKNLNIDSKNLNIEWNDGHKSEYNIDWLKARDFSEENQKRYLNTFYRPDYIVWGKNDFKQICKEYQFNDVMNNDEALKSWLESLSINGVVMIKNSPIDKGTIRKLANRIAFIKKTHYGEEFIVQAKPNTKNYAYLSEPLPLHTDLPYYEYKPGVNLLHCLVQTNSSGGSNLLADGFYVAERIKNEYQDYFKILTEILVDWNDIGEEEDGNPFHSIFRSPVICLDKDEKYTRINHSIPQRDSHFNAPIDKVIPWYEAYGQFVKILHEETVAFKTSPGDILTFNNIRAVHGRTGYDDQENNVRYIIGAYLDWDMIYAKLRTMYKYR